MMQESFLTKAGDIDPMVARRAAAQACLEHANDAVEGWGDLAMQFLRNYARTHERVFGQDVTDAAEQWGLIAPPDRRAWGAIYTRAQKEGVILDDGKTRNRRNGNKAADYRSLLCGGL